MQRQARVLTLLVAALFVLIGLTPASGATVYPPPTNGSGQVSSSSVQAGGCVTFSGSGFTPGTPITITDNGHQVGTTRADPNGNFSTPVCFDSSAKAGRHTLAASGLGANGAARVVYATVTVLGIETSAGGGSGGGLPFTGFDLMSTIAVGAALILSGTAMVGRGRRRRELA